MRLQGKVAVVTGGARGFGQAIAERFAEEGANVVVGDILEHEGRSTVASIESAGGTALFSRTDVTVSQEVAELIALTESTYGRLDIVVANAGVLMRAGVEELTEDEFDRQVEVNVKGTWLTVKHALPALRRSGGGSLVLTSSAAAIRGLPSSALYGATKAAIVMLAKNTALAAAKDAIRCNAIAPGPVATEFYNFTEEERRSFVERFAPEVPLGFLGETRDIADAALFLASDEARWITGAVLVVDGGFTI